jgi:hypothetical protein
VLISLFCRTVVAISGDRFCCRVPGWTAYVGQRWDTFDVAPWNLYNIIWRFGQRMHSHTELGDE